MPSNQSPRIVKYLKAYYRLNIQFDSFIFEPFKKTENDLWQQKMNTYKSRNGNFDHRLSNDNAWKDELHGQTNLEPHAFEDCKRTL